MGTVRKRGRGWELDWRDHAGERHKITVRVRTKKAAENLLEDILAEDRRLRLGLAPTTHNPQRLTMAALAELWLSKVSAKRSKVSHSRDRYRISKHVIRSELGEMLLEEITAERMNVFLRERCEGYANSMHARLRAAYGAIFSFAIEEGLWTGPNPIDRVRKVKVSRREWEAKSLTLAEAHLIIAHAPSDLWANIFAVAIFAGLRTGEIAGLRRDCVDLPAGVLTVRWSYDEDNTKGGHVDRIPIHQDLSPYLAAALQASTHPHLVFPAPRGGMLSHDTKFAQRVSAAAGRAGIERHVRFHELRHTALTLLSEAGVAPRALQRIARHRDFRTTQGYLHEQDGYLADQIARFDPTPPSGPRKKRGAKVIRFKGDPS